MAKKNNNNNDGLLESNESEFEAAKRIAAEYYDAHPACPYNSLVVTSDGVVFYNTPHGKNAADNHAKATGVSLTVIERD